ncbi:YybH family protein [Gemmata sp.]|uniref:YybH family protein n=1 Tax=Gemmata sp. TaxID=1914242 RepID=UPI003F6F2BF1
MPDPDTRAADELRFRAKSLRFGCLATAAAFVTFVTLIVVVFPAVARTLGLSTPAADESQIRGVLDAQVAAWNTGDLDGFMAGYWRDEQLSFMSGDRVTRGWEATRARYQKKYFAPDKDGKLAERGELAFEELQVEEIRSAAAVVRGRYVLKLASETATGRFTLVFRKFPEGWRITSDHTSAADPPPPPKK